MATATTTVAAETLLDKQNNSVNYEKKQDLKVNRRIEDKKLHT